MPAEHSLLQRLRNSYEIQLPTVFQTHGAAVAATEVATVDLVHDQSGVAALFPHTFGLPFVGFNEGAQAPAKPLRAGVILSGGQAPGGHNVITGLFDGLKSLHPASELCGFRGGPKGLVTGDCNELTAEQLKPYRNTGGFDLVGSGRDKLESAKELAAVQATCAERQIDALVVIGGDDSNTNACVLAEHFCQVGAPLQVIGCPKTIDGDLRNACIEMSFGFDTACKVYGELIGNVARDTASARKYWHFIKLMGRSASHITLECALQTQPNIALISEEVGAQAQTLHDIVEDICNAIRLRAAQGRNYGVLLVPEGLIEFIPEFGVLIAELNDLLAHGVELAADTTEADLVAAGMTPAAAALYRSIPEAIRAQLVLDRDAHGNVQVSRIETEKLLADMTAARLAELAAAGSYAGKFSSQTHFFGYEGRCAPPSNFDANYAYSLGYSAAALIGAGKTGYISSVRNLTAPPSQWQPGGVPITAMMNLERRHGVSKPVIRKALVELNGAPFRAFSARRKAWMVDDCYVYPGPIQYFGPLELCDQVSRTLALEAGSADV